jgi:hypothetical protein
MLVAAIDTSQSRSHGYPIEWHKFGAMMFPNNTKYPPNLTIQGPQIMWHSTILVYSEIKVIFSLLWTKTASKVTCILPETLYFKTRVMSVYLGTMLLQLTNYPTYSAHRAFKLPGYQFCITSTKITFIRSTKAAWSRLHPPSTFKLILFENKEDN